jgi:hypothetical protein
LRLFASVFDEPPRACRRSVVNQRLVVGVDGGYHRKFPCVATFAANHAPERGMTAVVAVTPNSDRPCCIADPKLRAKGLVAKLPNSRRYQILPQGYSVCLVFLKLFERVYAPLTAGLLSPVSADARTPGQKRSQLDRLYHRVIDDLDALVQAVGLKAAA